jgi:hypothetical protein
LAATTRRPIAKRTGATGLVLGGDVESAAWAQSIAKCASLNLDLSAHFVKVSHHGSTNGYCSGLWERFAAADRPTATVTLYRRSGLPQREAMDHIGKHSRQIFVTNRRLVPFRETIGARLWDDWDLAVRLVARAAFRTLVPEHPDDLGICSAAFDHNGKIYDVSCLGAAGALTPEAAKQQRRGLS